MKPPVIVEAEVNIKELFYGLSFSFRGVKHYYLKKSRDVQFQ